jgi:hypothetical protein
LFAAAIEAARHEVPSVLLVGGNAGIGKSTLVAEAARVAGAQLFLGRCVPVGVRGVALAPLLDLIRQIERSAQRAVLDEPRFAQLRDMRRPGATGVNVSALFTAAVNLLGAIGDADVAVVCVEDLHWADLSTWDLVEFVARSLIAERLVLVGTYRDEEVGGDPGLRRRCAELTRVPGTRRIRLAGLRRDEVAVRVQALLGAAPAAALVDDLFTRGEGNPLFTEELVAAHVAGDALPSLLSDLLAAEVTSLGPEARTMLATLAAIGREAMHDLLLATVPEPPDVVERGIRDALTSGTLVADRDTDRYRFRHPLIGEVIYDALAPADRRQRHARIAAALAARHTVDSSGEVAIHLDRAGDRPAALVASLAAADTLAAVAPAAALVHIDRALASWDEVDHPPAERIHRLWQAAELATATGANQHAVDLARTAFELGEPPRGLAWGYERLGRYLWAVGQLDASATAYREAASRLEADGGLNADAAAVFAGLAQADLMSCRFESAAHWCQRVLDTPHRHGTDPACVTAPSPAGRRPQPPR